MTRGRPRKDTTLGVGIEPSAIIKEIPTFSGPAFEDGRLYTLAAQIFAAKVAGAYAGTTDTAQAAIREARVFLDVFDAGGK